MIVTSDMAGCSVGGVFWFGPAEHCDGGVTICSVNSAGILLRGEFSRWGLEVHGAHESKTTSP
jgi:hypothetical protein